MDPQQTINVGIMAVLDHVLSHIKQTDEHNLNIAELRLRGMPTIELERTEAARASERHATIEREFTKLDSAVSADLAAAAGLEAEQAK